MSNVTLSENKKPMTVYGSVDRVIDGDTIVAHLRVLPGMELHGIHIRMEGINAPEMSTQAGRISKTFLEGVLVPEAEIYIKTSRQDKYGRVLGFVFTDRGENVSNMMLAAGYAVRYEP